MFLDLHLSMGIIMKVSMTQEILQWRVPDFIDGAHQHKEEGVLTYYFGNFFLKLVRKIWTGVGAFLPTPEIHQWNSPKEVKRYASTLWCATR